MWEIATLAIPFGFILSFLVGPMFFLLIETSISKGMGAAIALDIGVVISDACYILLALYSSKDLAEKIKGSPILFVSGGIILIAYGLTHVIQKGKLKHSRFRLKRVNYFQLIAKGFLMNIANVGVFIFWLGTVMVAHSQFNLNIDKTLLYFSMVLSTYFTLDLLKIFLAKAVKKKLTLRRVIHLKQIIGVILIAFGLAFIAKALLPVVSVF
ncbi:MAG: LysE family transporter [Flavobacteriales bacterium]